jgi:hypothetical protein
MKAVRTSETSVYSNQSTLRYMPEGFNLLHKFMAVYDSPFVCHPLTNFEPIFLVARVLFMVVKNHFQIRYEIYVYRPNVGKVDDLVLSKTSC